jgi:hypothetical protein
MSDLLNYKPKLTVRLSGGLGNQLFKSLVGYQIARKYWLGLALDTTWNSYPRRNFDLVMPRELELDYFESLAPFCRASKVPPVIHLRSGQIIRRLPAGIRSRLGYFVDGDLSEMCLENARTLDGSFENHTFLPEEKTLLQILEFPKQASPWLTSMMQRVKEDNPIAMHIRMGDYQALPELYELLTPSYYRRSLELIDASPKSTIWLFSDEPEKAFKWLGALPYKIQIIKSPKAIRAGEVMRLISSCPTIVTAHSTFSWWAGKLGTIFGTSKKVVMPSRFFRNQSDEDCLLRVPGWLVISV